MQVNYYAMRLKPELHEVFTEPKRAEQVRYHCTSNSDPEIEMCLILHILSVEWAISSHLFTHISPLSGNVNVCLQGSEPVHCALSVHWPKHQLRDEEINAKNQKQYTYPLGVFSLMEEKSQEQIISPLKCLIQIYQVPWKLTIPYL